MSDSDYLSEYQNKLKNPPTNFSGKSHAKETKNARDIVRCLEVVGNGHHAYFQYFHLYKVGLGSGTLELTFTDDIVRLEGTQDLLTAIAEQVSLHTLSEIRSVDPTHAEVMGQVGFVSKVEIQPRKSMDLVK